MTDKNELADEIERCRIAEAVARDIVFAAKGARDDALRSIERTQLSTADYLASELIDNAGDAAQRPINPRRRYTKPSSMRVARMALEDAEDELSRVEMALGMIVERLAVATRRLAEIEAKAA